MFTNNNLPLLAAELAEVDQMIGQLSPSAITSKRTLQNRKIVLQNKLKLLSEQPDTAALVELLFSGAPVLDSRAIDASFAADALYNYQDIIKKATAVKNGGLGSRGVVAGTAIENSRLFLTGIARGSFGFRLEENIDKTASFFDSTLKKIVTDVSVKMNAFCNDTDKEYDILIQEIDPRLFSSFKTFFKLLHESKAQMKVIDHHEGRIFDTDSINRAFVRTEATQVDDEERRVTGTLTGLADGMFNFVTDNQSPISGRLAPTFGLEYKNQVESSEFPYQLGTKYSAQIVKRITKRGAAAEHTAFFLVSLLKSDNYDNPDTNWHKI